MMSKEISTKEEQAAHRKEYKLEYQRQRRKRIKEITVPCPKEKYDSLKQRARKYNRTIGKYLLELEEVHSKNMRLDPNPKSTKAISRDILMVRMMLEDITEEQTSNVDFQKGLTVLHAIEELLRDLLDFGSH